MKIKLLASRSNKEDAKVKSDKHYEWHIYKHDRAVNIHSRSGKHTVRLAKGTKFGIRESSDGSEHRLITKEHGPTIVFSLNHQRAGTLRDRSRKARTQSMASTEEAGRKLPKDRDINIKGTNKRALKKYLRKYDDPNENAHNLGYVHGFGKNAKMKNPYKPGSRYNSYNNGFGHGQIDYKTDPLMHSYEDYPGQYYK